ncbi:MAG: LytTR family DNA-binding domain-containing protein [Thermomonas sp.]
MIWIVVFSLGAVANTLVVLMDAGRDGMGMPVWEPVIWEASSAIVSLALLPALFAMCRRWPLHFDTLRRHLPIYVIASVIWSLLHVVGMVLLRKLAYAVAGGHYDFGNWPRELSYEYLKDVRTFSLIVMVHQSYEWFWRRWQGEARLLDAPDDGSAADPVERPERFLVRKLGREFLVAANDIEWLQAAGNYVNLRVRERDYPLRSTVAAIESMLDPARFTRIHRSYIVNLDQVASIEPLDTGDARVHLKDGTLLPCSRTYRDVLKPR